MESKVLDLQHTLNRVQLSRSACRKQLHKAMNFAKDLVAEQEALLRTLSKRQKENKAVKRLGTDIATRMDTLRSQLKVCYLSFIDAPHLKSHECYQGKYSYKICKRLQTFVLQKVKRTSYRCAAWKI